MQGMTSSAFAQNWQWVRKDGAGGKSVGTAIGTDKSGNCYIVGNFWDTVQFGDKQLYGMNGNGLFIAKYAGSGELLWVKEVVGQNKKGDNAADVGGLAVDEQGDCIVAGQFRTSQLFLDSTPILN